MPRFFVDADISKAKTLDKNFYINQDSFEEAKEKIFVNAWQYIGNTDQLQEPTNCYPFTLLPGYLNEPLVLTRDKEGEIHCLSNVCTHRGNLLVYEPCASAKIRCKYHGRIFQLNGKMISMPEFKEVKGFPSANDDLHQLPLM